MITDDYKEDALQVAAVRLRLEGVPFKVVHRRDYPDAPGSMNWSLPVDSCVVYCRTTMAARRARALTVVVASKIECGYILEDGIEQRLYGGAHLLLHQLAMQLRGIDMFMASGAN